MIYDSRIMCSLSVKKINLIFEWTHDTFCKYLIWIFIHIEDSDEINNLIKLNSRYFNAFGRISMCMQWKISFFLFWFFRFFLFLRRKTFVNLEKLVFSAFVWKTYNLVESYGRQDCYFFISSQFYKFWKFFRVDRFDRIISESQISQKLTFSDLPEVN